MENKQIKEIWGSKIGPKSNQFDQEKVLLEIVSLAIAEERKRIVEIIKNRPNATRNEAENEKVICSDDLISLISKDNLQDKEN